MAILIQATPVGDYHGMTIAKSDLNGEYQIYADYGYVEGEFKTEQQAKDFIDKLGVCDVVMKTTNNVIDLRDVLDKKSEE